jgi:hypothetical protein
LNFGPRKKESSSMAEGKEKKKRKSKRKMAEGKEKRKEK